MNEKEEIKKAIIKLETVLGNPKIQLETLSLQKEVDNPLGSMLSILAFYKMKIKTLIKSCLRIIKKQIINLGKINLRKD